MHRSCFKNFKKICLKECEEWRWQRKSGEKHKTLQSWHKNPGKHWDIFLNDLFLLFLVKSVAWKFKFGSCVCLDLERPEESWKLEVALSQDQQLLNHLLAPNTEINLRFSNMPPFPYLHNTAIYDRRNNWSFKSSKGKKTLQNSLPSAAQHASGDLSFLRSPTQGMTQGLSFYYITRHRMFGVMANNKDDCETILKGLQSIFQVYLIMDHAYRFMTISKPHTKCGSVPV